MSLLSWEKEDQTRNNDGEVHKIQNNEDDFGKSVENDRKRFLRNFEKSPDSFPVDKAHC